MKYLFKFCILIFCVNFSIHSQTTKKVLFLGNSYTGVNNLPAMVNTMATSTGDVLIYDSNTPGGYRLIHHASNTTTLNKINSDNWDYVVLQGQSQETSWSQTQMQAEVFPYALSLSNAIRANYECSEPMFYMTWGRENGDASNCGNLDWVCTYEGMDDAIRSTYITMANDNNAEVSPAGAVWRYLRNNHPSLDLYTNDGSHPSLAGSYAAACAFYTMVYKKDPTLITWNSGLSTNDANTIKMAAKTIVFDEISNWDFTINPAMADYTEVVNEEQISFTNTSNDFDSLLWDFGDGNTSTAINPIHMYAATGDYMVTLTVTKCGKSNTKTKTFSISNLSTEDLELKDSIIFPNPVSDLLTIHLNTNYEVIDILIFDVSGKLISKNTSKNTSTLNLDFSKLSSGMYLLNVSANRSSFTSYIIKK
ncbi:T9SS type A sorting domain-containing protein [uncultured Psychroserpens sp.]|uniref:T9SS type A sorting domain-containing protein n=1 Tax=uncultured Psychroserpens sp. TaxID=255436 RepID=UPI00260B7E96|nr:T9SS type A sorting domain-containing protein [uncultured Psychroserpens sp.]